VDAEDAGFSPSASSADQVRLTAAKSLYWTPANQFEQLRIAEQPTPGAGSILSLATANLNPVAPRPAHDAALGLAVRVRLGVRCRGCPRARGLAVDPPRKGNSVDSPLRSSTSAPMSSASATRGPQPTISDACLNDVHASPKPHPLISHGMACRSDSAARARRSSAC
jgi:hypothetical protein